MKKTVTKKTTETYDKDTLEWINSKGGNRSFREKVISVNKKHNVDLVVFEPGVFDYGVKRVGHKRDGYVVVYDYDKTVEALANDYYKWNHSKKNENRIKPYTREDAYTDAVDWVEFNTIRQIPYIKGYAPKMVGTDENGRERKIS